MLVQNIILYSCVHLTHKNKIHCNYYLHVPHLLIYLTAVTLFSADLHDPEGCSSGKLSCEEELPELGGFPSFGDLPS